MRIELHIDRLLLDGLPVTDAQLPALRDALEHQLGALLAAQPGALQARTPASPATGARGAPAARATPDSAATPPLQLRAGMSAQTIGNRIAQAIHGSLGGSR